MKNSTTTKKTKTILLMFTVRSYLTVNKTNSCFCAQRSLPVIARVQTRVGGIHKKHLKHWYYLSDNFKYFTCLKSKEMLVQQYTYSKLDHINTYLSFLYLIHWMNFSYQGSVCYFKV